MFHGCSNCEHRPDPRPRYAWRYASRSNSTGRASRLSFSLEEITGMISIFSKHSSIQSARCPLSPARATGQATGSPSPSNTAASVPFSTETRAVLADMPAIHKLAREGARAQGMVSVFATVTWPNHRALVTGATTAKTGVVGNRV